MKTISFLTQKGGAGKSTLSINCAVHAQVNGAKVLLIDTDPQGTATDWYKDRPEDVSEPVLVSISPADVPEAKKKAKKGGFDVVIVDTPGRDTKGTQTIINESDCVLIPCRPSVGDLRASVPTATAISSQNKSFAFVLNQTPIHPKRANESSLTLKALGVVCPVFIPGRAAYQDAQIRGLGVAEYQPDSKAHKDIASLWSWVNERML